MSDRGLGMAPITPEGGWYVPYGDCPVCKGPCGGHMPSEPVPDELQSKRKRKR